MSSSRTPTQKTATKMPSFTSCFGASIPVSPRREGAQESLAGHAGINYRRLGLDDFEDEDQCGGTEGHSEKLNNQHLRQGAPITVKLGKHSSFKERPAMRSETVYVSEGEQEVARERTGFLKLLGTPRAVRVKAGSGRYSASETSKNRSMTESEGENHKHGSKNAAIAMQEETRKKEGMQVQSDNIGDQLRVKTGGRRRSESSKVGCAEVGDSPRRASFGSKMREACAQVVETARRGSPHLSELFVGNQLLMQVTASSSIFSRAHAKSMAPSYGFHVFTADPSSISGMVSSPSYSHSTSSASFAGSDIFGSS